MDNSGLYQQLNCFGLILTVTMTSLCFVKRSPLPAHVFPATNTHDAGFYCLVEEGRIDVILFWMVVYQ